MPLTSKTTGPARPIGPSQGRRFIPFARTSLTGIAVLCVVLLMQRSCEEVKGFNAIPRTRWACFLSLKRLDWAIALRASDDKRAAFDTPVHRITKEDQEQLIASHDLDAVVTDPVSVPPSDENYYYVDKIGAFCIVHGHQQGKSRTARRQLLDAGVTDKELLAAAWDKDPPIIFNPFPIKPLLIALVVALVLQAVRSGHPGSVSARTFGDAGWFLLAFIALCSGVPSLRGYWVPVWPREVIGEGFGPELGGLGLVHGLAALSILLVPIAWVCTMCESMLVGFVRFVGARWMRR